MSSFPLGDSTVLLFSTQENRTKWIGSTSFSQDRSRRDWIRKKASELPLTIKTMATATKSPPSRRDNHRGIAWCDCWNQWSFRKTWKEMGQLPPWRLQGQRDQSTIATAKLLPNGLNERTCSEVCRFLRIRQFDSMKKSWQFLLLSPYGN